MARRQSVFEDLIDITSRFPWWVGITLAMVSYFVLHYMAMSEIQIVTEPGKIGENVKSQLIKTLANVGQYLLPFVFFVGAFGSFIGRMKRHSLLSSANTSKSKSVINGMSWQEFEMLVGEAYRRKGYKVIETPSGADGGVDLVLTKDGEKTLVQCKHWKVRSVGVKVVRELYGVMAANGAEYGVVVTSGNYTHEAEKFASVNLIELINGKRLAGMIRSVKQPAVNTVKATVKPSQQYNNPMLGNTKIPSCPICNAQMVKRVAKRGENTGKSFWGCPGYPKCRGTIDIN